MVVAVNGHRRANVARSVAVVGAALTLMVGTAGLGGAVAGATPNTDPYSPPSVTVQTPSTDDCAQQQKPPPAVDTSEDVPPGQTAPEPLPVPDQPVGGGQLGSCGFALPADAPPLPSDISAGAWLIADLDTGEVLAAKDPHGRYRPASTLKLLTAQVMLKNLTDLDQVVEGSQADTAQDGTRVGIEAGGKYTVRDLLSYLVMISGNDAANALARTNGGYDKTVADMNATAKALGALDTRAATPSGLDGPGQSTSAYDLALFARADMNTAPFPELISRPDIRVPGADGGEGYIAANDNQILAQYKGGLGGKTGFTDDAGNTFVGMAEQNGRRLVVTMMHGSQQPRRQWMQAASLLDWGFALPAGTPGVGQLVTSLAQATGGSSPTPTVPTSAPGSSPASTITAQDEPVPSAAASQQPTSSGLSTSVLVLLLIAVLVVVVGVLLLLRRRHLNQQAAFAGDAVPEAADAHLGESPAAGAVPAGEQPDPTTVPATTADEPATAAAGAAPADEVTPAAVDPAESEPATGPGTDTDPQDGPDSTTGTDAAPQDGPDGTTGTDAAPQDGPDGTTGTDAAPQDGPDGTTTTPQTDPDAGADGPPDAKPDRRS